MQKSANITEFLSTKLNNNNNNNNKVFINTYVIKKHEDRRSLTLTVLSQLTVQCKIT